MIIMNYLKFNYINIIKFESGFASSNFSYERKGNTKGKPWLSLRV
ncbi:MAG: hypothetical protein UU34_C0003G0011 [Candidatus Curtissbacteria bacterium GW2011_GWA1_41_11]|uniref:Uncharacterized protein n=1 Tax=Candidatus Curtissbacteria bacterium GW2011_GWA1_41_11 TaxID=1618409 RepID=A0A0G0UFK4_9BACT|nr:MAG: hypothetical protein UU34_C0003G0011 [Candidatus Curtissbacteria bacterium GW2011_GWA1_41_11]